MLSGLAAVKAAATGTGSDTHSTVKALSRREVFENAVLEVTRQASLRLLDVHLPPHDAAKIESARYTIA